MTRPVTAKAFANAVQPIAADTVIITDDRGLVTADVSIKTKNGTIPGYQALPAGDGKYPIVLVIQEIFGVHEHIKDVARRFAKLGYLAVAPELYYRQGDVSQLATIDEIRQVVSKVPDEQVLSDLDATLAWASEHGGDERRVGVTGFCWGGRITWLYTAHQQKVKAAVAWYGRLVGDRTPNNPKHPVDVAASLKGRVLGLYGGQDQGIPLENVERLRSALAKVRDASNVVVYDTAPHAFYADYRPSFHKEAAEDGWKRLKAWFDDHGV